MTIETVIMLPVIFLLMFSALQAGLWFHARSVALGAAQEGARVASAEQGTGSSGQAAALDFIVDAGGSGVLDGYGVSGSRGGTEASFTVTGEAQSVFLVGHPPSANQQLAPWNGSRDEHYGLRS
ncbi:TadE/TadG family type IV pilus assembly protein [Ornithinimicrobium sp. INDO-MA30-4]|uniref:TadE/TadG family type IV pilus assembly protein n=1 Tax=Ornithinimicrobium sp. INDO-MA30-4 TaxID=2908651 RepID=UPI001F4378FD|nr:TadE/TadG family type IV pilus assembly protein [Ornithinimicrobium sp. INDO-MA30-4]UJH71770.1 pilus assembly protein [Ornithinimicrobium sp. INDO-MA30-4]